MNNTIQHDPDGGFTVLSTDHRTGYVPRPYNEIERVRQHRPEDPGMYGVQTWSAGPIYPAIIHMEEVYTTYSDYQAMWVLKPVMTPEQFYAAPLFARLLSRKFVLTIPGQEPIKFDSRGAAEVYALRMQGRVPS